MAIVDMTVNQGNQPSEVGPALLKFEKTIDFSVTANNLASADTAKLFDLPADILVIATKVEVLTPEGSTCTADLGITGGDVDKYIDGVDLNATAGTNVLSGDAGTPEPIALQNNGSYLAAAETVSLLANNAIATAKIRVQIIAIDMRKILADPA